MPPKQMYINWLMANHHLQTELYKAIVALKSELESDWANGLRGNGYDSTVVETKSTQSFMNRHYDL